MNLLPPAYFITRDPTRERQFRVAWQACGLEPASKWPACFLPSNPRLGNAISHYSLTQHLYESGIEEAIILEDDSIPCDQVLTDLPKELEGCRADGVTLLRTGWTQETEVSLLGTQAYVFLSREGMLDWMRSFGFNWKMDFSFDHMKTLVMQSSKCYFAQYVPNNALESIHAKGEGWFGEMMNTVGDVTFKKACTALRIREPISQRR